MWAAVNNEEELCRRIREDGYKLEKEDDTQSMMQYLDALNKVVKDKRTGTAKVKKVALRVLELPVLEKAFDDSVDVQKLILHLMVRLYRDQLHMKDILTLFSMAEGKDDIELHWSEAKKIFGGILRILYMEGVLCKNTEDDLVLDFCRLLCEMVSPAQYFASAQDDAADSELVEEHLLSEYCLRILALSEAIMDFGSVGDILMGILEYNAPYAKERVLSCLIVFRRVCDLLPGDGFEFRCFLAFGNLLQNLCLPFMRQCWQSMWNEKKKPNRWVELLDDASSQFFFVEPSTGRSRRTAPLRFDSESNSSAQRGFAAVAQLLISMGYESSVQMELARHDITRQLLLELPPLISDSRGRFHRQEAWLLLYNVSCCFGVKEKSFHNEIAIKQWISSLSVGERTRIAHAFVEQSVNLPSHDYNDTAAYRRMYELIISPATANEDPSMWISCGPSEGIPRYYCKVYDENAVAPQTTWDRPCVTQCAWSEVIGEDGKCLYIHFLGDSRRDVPSPKSVIKRPDSNQDCDKSNNEQPDRCTEPLEFRSIVNLPPLIVKTRGESGNSHHFCLREEKWDSQLSNESKSDSESKIMVKTKLRKHQSPQSVAVKFSIPESPSSESKLEDNRQLDRGIPKSFLCHLTNRIMRDPVSAFGYVYDKQAIEHFLRTHGHCPNTGKELELEDLCLERELHNEILLWHIRMQQQRQEEWAGAFFDVYDF